MRNEPPPDADYDACVSASERVAWRLDDVFPVDRKLDFGRRFLPEALVNLADAPLGERDKLTLNHIRGHSYVNLFVFVEEYIIATAMRHANAEQFGSPPAMRALLRFADEELKHQQLFRRFQAAFARGFEHRCDVLDNAVEVAGFILSKPALTVMLTTLHLELITQQHYVGAIKTAEEDLEPSFRSMFEHHWIEEAQHARIDALEIAKLAAACDAAALERALAEYEEIMVAFDKLLCRQAEMDVTTLERVRGQPLDASVRTTLVAQQQRSYRSDFLHAGFENSGLTRVVERHFGNGALSRLRTLAERFA